MRQRLAPIAGWIFRLSAAVSLLLAVVVLILAIWTAARPLRLRHNSDLPEPLWSNEQLRLDVGRGQFWILLLEMRESNAPLGGRFFDPPMWSITRLNTNWRQNLTPQQTGPVWMGFSTRLRHVERRQPVLDKTTGIRRDSLIIEEERITCVPLPAVVMSLLILPAI
jgi:hypothetical protein